MFKIYGKNYSLITYNLANKTRILAIQDAY